MFLFLLMAASAQGPRRPIKIALAGDSTVEDAGGWGPGFQASFGPEVEVINLARGGRSSKSFRDEGLWAPVLAAKPDYVLLQFGHNDSPGKGPERETAPETTYRANMTRYVDEARAAGAKPILVTSIVRRNFTSDGKIKPDSLVPYVHVVRDLAAAKQVPLIDLYALTLAQSETLGPKGSEELGRMGPDGKPDHTHLGPKGKAEIGAIAAREFVKAEPALKPYLHDLVGWRDAMRQPHEWYGSAEAIRIAANLLRYQNENGGWDKNIDMSLPVTGKPEGHSTIDNNATYTQMRFLARVYTATHRQPFAAAFERGLNYLFEAQYANGGWPQFYPLRHGYWDHITYNDDAMIGVMETLRSIVQKDPDFEFAGEKDRERAGKAIEKGIRCILKTQVVVDGKPTVWCAQHDEKTLAPAKARAYELASLSGGESVGIVRFLMGIERPDEEVVSAVQSAVAWFNAVKITGIRLEKTPDPATPKGYDEVVVSDPKAPPLWARFYEIGTNRPIFSSRDGVVKYKLYEISYERRNGYRWYVDKPARLLDEDYPK
ncbi:MAG: pectate lyase, partial [Acidobacteriota bacterium]|nr:pectate lyase [Acidobacteriota bacterium]